MKNTIKFLGIIAFVAVIGFAAQPCFSLGSSDSGSGSRSSSGSTGGSSGQSVSGSSRSGSRSSSGSGGGDKRVDLLGDWEVAGSYYPTYFQLSVADGKYSLGLESGGGGDYINCELLSYDGNNAVLSYESGTMPFTARITGNTLVISGLTNDEANFEYFEKFNGSYTKLESAPSYDYGDGGGR